VLDRTSGPAGADNLDAIAPAPARKQQAQGSKPAQCQNRTHAPQQFMCAVAPILDPSDDTSIWIAQEYASSANDQNGNYDIWVARFLG